MFTLLSLQDLAQIINDYFDKKATEFRLTRKVIVIRSIKVKLVRLLCVRSSNLETPAEKGKLLFSNRVNFVLHKNSAFLLFHAQ